MNMIYSDGQLADILAWRQAGHEWAEVAKKFNNKYNEEKTSEAMRCVYKNYKHLLDVESDVVIVKNLRQVVRNRATTSSMARQNRAVLNYLNEQDDILDCIKEVVAELPAHKKEAKKAKIKKNKPDGKPMTIELLFSDWQIGKLMDDYNSEVAIQRLQEYTWTAISKIEQYKKLGYNVERIVLAMLGDIIESSEKHKNSARSTDCSTPAQIQKAIENLYCELLVPLSDLGIDMDVFCVPGNHDWNEHGLNMYNPGEEHYSWIIYNTLQLLADREGLVSDVRFDIAKGCYTHTEIYGHTVIYEHGVGIPVKEDKMKKRLGERARQLKKFCTYYRMGDKHNISRFNEDTLVVNGAFFGGDSTGSEFSSIMGYSACAGQIMFAYVPREDERLPIYDSFTIQLQHIK